MARRLHFGSLKEGLIMLMGKVVGGAALAAAILMILPCALAASDIANAELVRSLQTAYSAETNTYQLYLAFAAKADEEGYTQAASLFRAVARAEQIHYTLHNDAIKEMGIAPEATVTTPMVESTKANLEIAANNSEVTERDTLYPDLIKQARAAGNRKAVQTYEAIRKAEAEHYKLFVAAARGLNQMRGGTKSYFICPADGFVALPPGGGACSGGWEVVK